VDGDEDARMRRRRLPRERKHMYGFDVVLWFPHDTASPLWVSGQAGDSWGPHMARSFVILIFIVIFVFYSLNQF